VACAIVRSAKGYPPAVLTMPRLNSVCFGLSEKKQTFQDHVRWGGVEGKWTGTVRRLDARPRVGLSSVITPWLGSITVL
jgi:hypothetical protein